MIKWKEVERDAVWESKNYIIKKTERYKNSAIIPERIKNLGQYIFHCYKKNDKQNIYIAQTVDLLSAKKCVENLGK